MLQIDLWQFQSHNFRFHKKMMSHDLLVQMPVLNVSDHKVF